MSSAISKAINARLATPGIFTRTFMLGIVGSLAAYLTSWENADRIRDNYLESRRDTGDTFDFIIVGGGTAGVILANRLSEKYKTLLLEAGGEPHPFQAVPLLSNYLLNYAEIDWRHVTMPQKQGFLGSIQSRASISQGRGLGGTSNLDSMIYLRGHPQDYDNWANVTGDKSWSYKSVVQHFKSLEEYNGPWRGENHGESGPMKIKQPSFTGLGAQFCQAAVQNGYKHIDLNDAFVEGCDILTYPSKRGYRDSIYSSFYKPVKDSWNLVVNKYAHVNKVLIRGNDNVAYGVEYDRHGKSHVAYANKEVVITSGAIQTPKILMLSGIGPKADLSALGIPVIADLPVGTNLQDHPSVFLGPFFVDNGRSLNIDRDVSASAVLQLARDSGPLTTTGFQAAAVISSGLEKLHGSRNWPDLQLTMYGLAHHKSADEDFSHAFKLRKELLKSYMEHSKGLDSFSVLVTVGRPKSSGTVKLLNKNPYAPLIINPNYFDKIYDVVVMVDGVKKALRMVENSTVFHNELHTRFTQQVLPGCEKFRFRSDAYFECYVRTLTVSYGNVAGTAAMGGVLNSKMQVKGVKSLRVMDASVMPSIVTTSTGASVMMIAEKGADLLLKEWERFEAESNKVPTTNHVTVKPKVKANQLNVEAELTKALLNSAAFKVKPSTKPTNSPTRPRKPFNLADLQKLTKSVGSLAALLDPVLAESSSPLKNVYTGSFSLENDKNSNKTQATQTQSPLRAMMTLAPILKSQLGGLYKNYFEDAVSGSTEKAFPQTTKTSIDLLSKLVSGLKIPILPGKVNFTGNSIQSSKNLDPLKVIQGMLDKNMKDLKELELLAKLKDITSSKVNLGDMGHDNLKQNITLDDIFGIADDYQDELAEYEILDISTEKPAPVAKNNGRTVVSSTTTAKPAPIYTTTTKKPLIDYTYEVLPVPLAKSKAVESFTSPSASISVPISVKPQISVTMPVYPKPNANIPPTVPVQIVEAISIPVPKQGTSPSVSVAPASVPKPVSANTPPVKSQEPDLRKLKLDALAQIQHDTLVKLKEIQSSRAKGNRPRPANNPPQLPPLRHPALPSFRPPSEGQQNQGQPEQSIIPAIEMIPSPVRGFIPTPQQHFNKPSPQLHTVYKHPLQSPPPYNNNRFLPSNIGGPLRSQLVNSASLPDSSDLKYSVHSIMNAKYTHPTVNPFTSILNFHSSTQESDASTVLKALELRSNVDKLLDTPFRYHQPSPIPITHRPTYPPPTTRPPPPSPMSLHEFQQDAGIFAPLKDALEPLTNLMKAPLSFIPNPFKSSSDTSGPSITKTIASSLLPESITSSSFARSLLPDIFQHRTGPISADPPSDSQTSSSQRTSITKNSLAAALPRFFMNASRSNSDIPPEVFLLALANMTTGLPKPFVLEPSKTLSLPNSPITPDKKQEHRNKKLLDESISDILSHLNNHHFTSISSPSDFVATEDPDEISSTGSSMGVNSANEILNIDYNRGPPVKPSVASATPKTNTNPPVEFHKSLWAKEPLIPTKSLHFKIQIVKN